MFKKLDELKKKYHELTETLARPEIASNNRKYRKYAKALSDIREIVETYDQYLKVRNEIEETKKLLEEESDTELVKLAEDELKELKKHEEKLKSELKMLLLPKDPNDEKNTIVEIRAGAGGDEAGLFAADLFRMYSKYAESQGWKCDVISINETGIKGFKEIIFALEGKRVYSRMKYESGVHRVQRVPVTEVSGRIHTSTATVAVLVQPDECEVRLDPRDLKIDVFRSQGPGGQSVNTTDSAVRITHLPTGLVVQCQDEKSQHKNKERATKILRARLLEKMQKEQRAKIAEDRRSQVGTGERSEKIRTYNFPQGRVTDHRVPITLHKLQEILNGDLDDIINHLNIKYQTEKMKKMYDEIS